MHLARSENTDKCARVLRTAGFTATYFTHNNNNNIIKTDAAAALNTTTEAVAENKREFFSASAAIQMHAVSVVYKI